MVYNESSFPPEAQLMDSGKNEWHVSSSVSGRPLWWKEWLGMVYLQLTHTILAATRSTQMTNGSMDSVVLHMYDSELLSWFLILCLTLASVFLCDSRLALNSGCVCSITHSGSSDFWLLALFRALAPKQCLMIWVCCIPVLGHKGSLFHSPSHGFLCHFYDQ